MADNNRRIGEITHVVVKQGDERTLAVGFTNFGADTIHAVKLSIEAIDSFNEPILFDGIRWLIAKRADLNVRQNERSTVMIPLGNYDIKNVSVKIEQIVYSTGEIVDLPGEFSDYLTTNRTFDDETNGDENPNDMTGDCYDNQEGEHKSESHGPDIESYTWQTKSHASFFRTQTREASGILKLGVLILLIVFYPLGLVVMWEKKVFSVPVRISLTTLFALFFVGRLISVNQRKQSYNTESMSTVVETSGEKIYLNAENETSMNSAESSETSENASDAATIGETNDDGVQYSEDGTEYAILYDGRTESGNGRIDIYVGVSREDVEMKAHVENVLSVYYDECVPSEENPDISNVIIYVYNTPDIYGKYGVVQGQYCVAYWTTDEKNAITWMPEGTGVGVEANTEAWVH